MLLQSESNLKKIQFHLINFVDFKYFNLLASNDLILLTRIIFSRR